MKTSVSIVSEDDRLLDASGCCWMLLDSFNTWLNQKKGQLFGLFGALDSDCSRDGLHGKGIGETARIFTQTERDVVI